MLVMWLDEKEEQNRMKEMMSNMYAPVSPVISPKTPIADAQELWNLKDPFVNPVKNLKHNDALDSMSYGVKNMYPINAGADMDGDVFATT
jgi:hypothetical protein